jgi:hypothetical protein
MPVDVVFRFDGAPGAAGVRSYPWSARRSRPDLCALLGSCTHGFATPTPYGLFDGALHTVRATAMDTTFGPYLSRDLSGGPRTFRGARPPHGVDDAAEVTLHRAEALEAAANRRRRARFSRRVKGSSVARGTTRRAHLRA